LRAGDTSAMFGCFRKITVNCYIYVDLKIH
jgi:hypothetical protein